MRDGELTPGIKMNVERKMSLAKILEAMRVDIIEVSYPGQSEKDFHEISTISKVIKNSTICGLASSKESEILKIAEGIKAAEKGRIHFYTNVNLKDNDKFSQKQTLETIKTSVSLAKNCCDDVEWSAFDGTRSETDFLCKAIETAIKSGANTINIPDSLGTTPPEKFTKLLEIIFNRVPNINDCVLSVHCHDDLGMAVENSIVALNYGVRQIECSVNGLGARKGNADLAQIVREVLNQRNYQIDIDTALMSEASELVSKITGKEGK